MPQTEQKQAPGGKATASPALLQKSALYREFLAEREQILRHKWIESEKVGADIGFEKASLDWLNRFSDSWVKNHQNTRKSAPSRSAKRI